MRWHAFLLMSTLPLKFNGSPPLPHICSILRWIYFKSYILFWLLLCLANLYKFFYSIPIEAGFVIVGSAAVSSLAIAALRRQLPRFLCFSKLKSIFTLTFFLRCQRWEICDEYVRGERCFVSLRVKLHCCQLHMKQKYNFKYIILLDCVKIN